MASAEHEPITGVWEPPAESRGRAPGQGVRGGSASLKLKAFWSFDVQRSRH